MTQTELDLDYDAADERQLLAQLLHITQEIRANQCALDDRLWKYQDVAIFLQTSDQNARHILRHPKAPRPVQVNTTGNHTMPPRYYPEEVKAFIKREGREPSRR